MHYGLFTIITLTLLFPFISTYDIKCERPSTTTPNNKTWTPTKKYVKYCRYRERIVPQDLFNELSGFNCYAYGDVKRFKNNTPYKAYSCNVRYEGDNQLYRSIPISYYNNNTAIFTYNFRNELSLELISESFQTEKYFDKWLKCAQEAEKCCENMMTNENIITEGECPVVWDAWDCFAQTKPGNDVENSCPNYIYMSDPPCVQKSRKTCFENATWNEQTNYEPCQFLSNVRNRHIFHVNALYVSIAICVPAILIFYSYRALRITRVILHRNLLIAITLKNVLVILSKVLITIEAMDTKEEESLLVQNTISCRVLAFFERAAINAMYACMLVDGFYLHKLIVTVFRSDPPMSILYTVVAVFSLVPILIWAALKATQANVYCWIVDESWRQWIIDGSRYTMLGINLFLLLDIIRVLVWKLKSNSGAQHTKTTLRATFILLPLFGIQFIMMSQRPVNAPCVWDDAFYYISYAIDSSQGILVSLLYCYFNKEKTSNLKVNAGNAFKNVQALLKNTYYKIKNEFVLRFTSRFPVNNRRTTTATFVADNSPRSKQDKNAMNKLNKIVGNKQQQNLNVQEWMQRNDDDI